MPRHDLVVVVTGGDNRSFGAPVDFLYWELLPAVVLPWTIDPPFLDRDQ